MQFCLHSCGSWKIARTKITGKSRRQSRQIMKWFSLYGKCFWKVDKHKRNDQSGIIHSFGKSKKNWTNTRRTTSLRKIHPFERSTKRENNTDFPTPKIFSDSRKVDIRWLVIPQISLAIPNLLFLHTSASAGSPVRLWLFICNCSHISLCARFGNNTVHPSATQ